ncbi:NRDE family protein [Nonomuraea typhae]|uniref:NRDE family protein n=1 Tax=Nonomuraea typhae TaxID=2603600 RepID=UPI0012F8E04D|nr:NRDE family protein [Nonomuraea typhae]
MCTVIVRTGAPLTLMGVRDELADRPWEGPGEHWPEYPGVVGGRDLKAGGTWLAVDPATRRAAALLNGRGTAAPDNVRVSRGDLPLKALAAGGLPDVDLAAYDPFHLLLADVSGARLWSWDGVRQAARTLPEGVSVIVNTGLDPGDPRVQAQLPRFSATTDWWPLTDGPHSPAPGALILRHDLPDGRLYASLSVTMVRLSADAVTTEFRDLTSRIGSQA